MCGGTGTVQVKVKKNVRSGTSNWVWEGGGLSVTEPVDLGP